MGGVFSLSLLEAALGRFLLFLNSRTENPDYLSRFSETLKTCFERNTQVFPNNNYWTVVFCRAVKNKLIRPLYEPMIRSLR